MRVALPVSELSRETTATTPVVEPSGEIDLARNGGAVAAARK